MTTPQLGIVTPDGVWFSEDDRSYTMTTTVTVSVSKPVVEIGGEALRRAMGAETTALGYDLRKLFLKTLSEQA
jgi:hypothetical protein